MYDETVDGTCFRLYIITKYGKLNECKKLLYTELEWDKS